MNGEQDQVHNPGAYPMNSENSNIQPQTSSTAVEQNEVRAKFSVPHETVKVEEALEQIPKEEGKVGTVRTFQSDIAGAVKSDNVSMIKIALAEKERREKEGSYADLETKRPFNPLYYVAGALIIVITGVVGFVYYYFNKPLPPTLEDIIAPQEVEIIYSESQVAIPIENTIPSLLLRSIRSEVEGKFDLGTIKRIMLTSGTATSTRNTTSQDFFAKIRSRMSDSLNRSIEPYYFLGAYSFDPHDAIMVFKINSYDNAFPGMLDWENSLDLDIGPIFYSQKKSVPSTIISSSTQETDVAIADTQAGTSTINTGADTTVQKPVITTETGKPIWRDRIIQNKDTRVLLDENGNIKLLYSFIDRKTLVIVSSEKGFKEVIYRMTTGRIRR